MADALDRIYGAWAPRTPQDVASLFVGYPGVWWVAGGWALEAFSGVPREHDDTDPEVLREDLPALRRHLAGRYHAWCAFAGALKPLLPDDRPDAGADDVLPEGCGQLWLREGPQAPWQFDVLLSTSTADEWVCKRDPGIRVPLDDALWERDGIRYLRPELQLLLKAKGLRPKDQTDFDACLPLLSSEARAWLADALARVHPGHPWEGACRGVVGLADAAR